MSVALTRPLYITASNKDCTVKVPSGAGGTAVSLTTGLYGDVYSVMKEFETQIKTVSGGLSCSLDSSGKLVIAHSSSSFRIEFDDLDLADLLGFDAAYVEDTSSPYSATADMLPTHCWISNHDQNDQNIWYPNWEKVIAGGRAKTGRFVGIQTGSVHHSRTFSFVFEEAKKLFVCEATEADDEPRCLETFLHGALTDPPQSGITKSPKGFWIYYDSSDLAVDSDFSNFVGINYQYSVNADKKAYVHITPESWLDFVASYERHKERYNIRLEVQTADYDSGDFS